MAKVEIKNYTKEIKSCKVLSDINLTLESGNVYGFKGKNGSGKTMLMRAISGLIYPTQGELMIDGKVLGKDISFPPSIGILIENPSFLNHLTGKKNLELLASVKGVIGDKEIDDAIKRVGLVPEDKRTYRKYSLGMKQRLGIAAAIMERPDIIILDEPINALDEEGAHMIREILQEFKEQGKLIIIACHDTDELEYLADEIIYIYEGKIVEKTDKKRIV